MEATLAPLTAVVEIPLELIDPSPANPRHVITDAMVDALAENLKLVGQKTPAKVRPKGDGRYEVFAGHIRRQAALKAGLPTLKCLLLEITPEEAFLEAVLDNRGQQMGWLDDYLVVEQMGVLFPDMKQPEMASRLELNQSTVSRAQKIVGLLNQASRDLIYAQCIKSTPYEVSYRVVAALTGLVTGSPDDPTKVEAALRVAVDRQMKEKDALKLADWVKQGGKPEDFGQKDSKEPLNDPYAAYWPALGPGIKVKFKGGDTYQIQMTVKGHGETFNAALAASKALNDGKVGKAPRPQEPPNLFGSLKRGILPMKPPNLIGNVLKHAWREGLSAFRNPDRFKDALFGRQGRFAQLGYWLYVLALAWVVFKILAFVWGIVWNLF